MFLFLSLYLAPKNELNCICLRQKILNLESVHNFGTWKWNENFQLKNYIKFFLKWTA